MAARQDFHAGSHAKGAFRRQGGSPPSLCGFRRFCMKIDFRFRNLGQCAVRVLFFLERGIE